MRVELRRVRFMPKHLEPGVLYVSAEFGTAAHLCACGCGAKVRTPLGPTEWSLEETEDGPSLEPSIGNWQQACRSHYWIWRGQISWAEPWTAEEIAEGRRHEEARRREYYDAADRKRSCRLRQLWRWITRVLGQREDS